MKGGVWSADLSAGLEVFLLQTSQVRSALPHLEAVLNDAERTRAATGFTQNQAREEFVVGRSVLRLLLAQRLGVPAHTIALCVGSNGKPRLCAQLSSEIAFNVSHSHGVVAIALGKVAAVGIDVERVDEQACVVELAEVAWGVEAAAALAAIVSPAERCLTFFQQWVRFEAEAKSDGRGIAAMANRADKHLQSKTKPLLHFQEFDAKTDEFNAVGCVVCDGAGRLEAPTWLRLEHLLALGAG